MGGQNQTPRKRTHARNASASHRAAGVSDYDSDAAHLVDPLNPPPLNPALLTRTNTELNISVLRRYIPTIHSILSIAANAVVYTFAPATSSWERTGTEGTYFLCFLAPEAPEAAATGETAPASPRACIFVLNRRGLENTILDLGKVENFEVMDEIYIFKMEDDFGGVGGAEAGTDSSVVGVWIHAQDDEMRMENAAMVQETIRIVQAGQAQAEEELEQHQQHQQELATQPAATGGAAPGQRISVSQLFGGASG